MRSPGRLLRGVADPTQSTRPPLRVPAEWRQAVQPAWQTFRPYDAIWCVPVILGIMLVGFAIDQVQPALVMSTGALVIGFGAFQPRFRNPNTPMLAAATIASASAGIGTLANAWLPAEAICVLLWGTGLGLMNMIGLGPGWLALQGSIALVIAASFPATPSAALYRFTLVLAGALLQFIVILSLRAVLGRPAIGIQPEAATTLRAVLRSAARILRGKQPGLAYSLTLGLAATIAVLLGHTVAMANGYWIPMTLLLVLRPERRETWTRSILRLAGTLAGVVLVTLLLALLRPPVAVMLALIAVTVWSCYALLTVNYAWLSFAITSYVVLLFALAGLPEPVVALHRTVATALGGVIAIAAHALCRRLAGAMDAECA